jgi:hypothetical protein
MRRGNRAKEVVETTAKQLIFIAEMHIKSGSANISTIKNLLDYDRVIVPPPNK